MVWRCTLIGRIYLSHRSYCDIRDATCVALWVLTGPSRGASFGRPRKNWRRIRMALLERGIVIGKA